MRFHPRSQGKTSARMTAIISACRGKADTSAQAVSTVLMPPKVASVPTKAAGAPSAPSRPATAPKPTPAASAPTKATYQHQYRKYSASELKKIAAEAQAEIEAERKAKRNAQISALWDRAIALNNPNMKQPEQPKSAASAAWDRAYTRAFPDQPAA